MKRSNAGPGTGPMLDDPRQNPFLGRCILAGAIAGVIAAILANLALFVLNKHFGQSFEQLTWYSVTRASMISCVLAGFAYYTSARTTERPVLWFILAGTALATIDSVWVALHPPEAGFARIANPLHYVVAVTAFVFIPALATVLPQSRRSPPGPPPVPSAS